ncbi:MAG TPA: TetR/AcrR family transcriptional regulator [Rectinemataceae bacterium]|nr:TetR/AcrR family transcriptional regulator [Rectinemataceae bacterium]
MKGEQNDQGTAKEIREAAKRLFMEKGYDGTTMQAIADSSKVNKALLHYYFESKDRLFLLVFREELSELSASLASLWQEGQSPRMELLEDWIDSLIAFRDRSPRLPLFIITEMTRNPGLIKELLTEFLPPTILLQAGGRKGTSKGEYGLPVLVELVGMVYSLVFFPALAAPMIQHLLGVDSPLIDELMVSQARLAKDLVRRRMGGPLPASS